MVAFLKNEIIWPLPNYTGLETWFFPISVAVILRVYMEDLEYIYGSSSNFQLVPIQFQQRCLLGSRYRSTSDPFSVAVIAAFDWLGLYAPDTSETSGLFVEGGVNMEGKQY